jgi:hypothetical protein
MKEKPPRSRSPTLRHCNYYLRLSARCHTSGNSTLQINSAASSASGSGRQLTVARWDLFTYAGAETLAALRILRAIISRQLDIRGQDVGEKSTLARNPVVTRSE